MISTITYNGDGTNRIFPVSFEIKGEEYIVVFINDIAVADKTKYDIINNSVVFTVDEAPITGVDNVVIAVASSPTEIADLNAPPSIIQSVIDNMTDILNVSNHSAQIDVVSTNISNIQAVSANDVNISIVADDIDNIDIISTNISSVNTVATNIVGLNTVVTNIDEILLADENAIIATTKASESLFSANNARASALVAGAYANINWAGFSVSDGDLIVYYADGSTSTPSLADGEFIITY